MKLKINSFCSFIGKIGILGLTIGFLLGIALGISIFSINPADAAGGNTLISPLPTNEAIEVIPPVLTPSPTPEATEVTPEPVFMPRANYEGKASIYSRAGCLGCSPTLTMANGQPLDDNALTVAFNDEPLGTMLKITNPHTNKTVIAEVTDTGGFKRHGRIIDVVPAVASALELKTDQVLSIEVIN